jgi:hypothetical protein
MNAPMSGTEILKRGLSNLHESLADYMLINPGCTLREMGAYFGYSGAWICTVINSDMFKAYMAQRRAEITSVVAEDLPSRLHAAAHLATERIIEVIEKSEDSDTLIDAFDKVLHRYGYAPNAKGGAQSSLTVNQQNNVFYLSKEELADVRGKFVGAHSNRERVLPAPPAQEDTFEVLSGDYLPTA